MKNYTLLMFFVVLAGCGENTLIQTVTWYKEHDADRKEMLAKCKADPGRLGESANCVNAQQAENQKTNAKRGWVTPNAGSPGTKEN